MTQLNKFTFSIKTLVCSTDTKAKLQSIKDIQHSFIGRRYEPVASSICVPTSFSCDGECHIYSLPYDFEYFRLDNSFQGGVFHKVRRLEMIDQIAFEYKFFELISRDFPFLEMLHVETMFSPEIDQHSSTLITFPYLKVLDVKYAHFNYAVRFLLKKFTHLPCLSHLTTRYNLLISITGNFTIDPTFFNFGSLKSLDLCQSFVRPDNFHQYFPLL